jgi:hypothetical protein
LPASEEARLLGGTSADDIADAVVSLDQRAGDEVFGVSPAARLKLRDLRDRAQSNSDLFPRLYEQVLAALKLQVLAPVVAIKNRHGYRVIPAAVRCRRSASTATVTVDISFVPVASDAD